MIEKNFGELTILAEEALWAFNDSNTEERNAYLKCDENYIKFSDGVKNYIYKKYGMIPEKELVCFIEKVSKERNIELPMITIKNWLLDKTNPQSSTASRDNVFKLCFALDFSVKETIDFFSKVYLDRPFDVRDVKEATYLFCMNNHYSYSKAKELIEIIDKKECLKQESEEEKIITKTKILNRRLMEIENETDFLYFVEANKNSFEIKNKTAMSYYTELLKDSMEIAKVSSNDGLLNLIYDCRLAVMQRESKSTIKGNTNFLPLVKMNFPQKEQLSQINKEVAKYDTIRKALILLKFFSFFMHVGEHNQEEDFDDFCSEMNDMLNECGYALLYPRNPYDWLFMHCAACSHDKEQDIDMFQPLDELRDIMCDMFQPLDIPEEELALDE